MGTYEQRTNRDTEVQKKITNIKNSARAESRHHYKRAQEYTPNKSYP